MATIRIVADTLTRPSGWRETLARARVRVSEMMTAFRTRGDLYGLDAHTLKDIGVTRLEAVREARRPFWDVPRAK